MRYLPTGKWMQEADRNTIEGIGIPSLVLMERAALESFRVLQMEELDFSRVLLVCGSGNNGGDGFVLARLLKQAGHHPIVVFAGKEESRSPECKKQMEILENLGQEILREIPEENYSVVVDALFGVGLSRAIGGRYLELLEKMNALEAYKVAMDIPSGVDSATGAILGEAFRADLTVTMQCEKLGTVLFPGKSYSGKVCVADIGIDISVLRENPDIAWTYEKKDLSGVLPERREDSNKGNFGRVLVIAGSPGMAGAAYFCASAAYALGAGLVKVYTAEENASIIQQLLPEALLTTYRTFQEEDLQRELDWADVTVIGPGLSKSHTAELLLECVLKNTEKACVIDADGLNLLSEHNRIELLRTTKGTVILTPHMKEMQRLLHAESIVSLKEKRLSVLDDFVNSYPAVCVMKDARTVVGKADRQPFVNTSGNNALAKGSAGDVLAGTIAGLLAQGMEAYEAACLGVYLHGMAGDRLREKKGAYGVMASDLVRELQNCGRMGD